MLARRHTALPRLQGIVKWYLYSPAHLVVGIKRSNQRQVCIARLLSIGHSTHTPLLF
jgi:hypothetical protein